MKYIIENGIVKPYHNNFPRFQETYMGQIFYNHQLPELIKALNNVADGLQKNNFEISDDLKQMIVDNLTKIAKLHPNTNFFQTVGGNEYYNYIIPNLIENLQKLAKQLKK